MRAPTTRHTDFWLLGHVLERLLLRVGPMGSMRRQSCILGCAYGMHGVAKVTDRRCWRRPRSLKFVAKCWVDVAEILHVPWLLLSSYIQWRVSWIRIVGHPVRKRRED